MKIKINNIYFFENGVTAIFDHKGNQSTLQVPWFRLYIEYLKNNNCDLSNVDIKMPSGRNTKLIELENGDFNWN